MSLCDHDHPQVKIYRAQFNALWTPEKEAAFKRFQARRQPVNPKENDRDDV